MKKMRWNMKKIKRGNLPPKVIIYDKLPCGAKLYNGRMKGDELFRYITEHRKALTKQWFAIRVLGGALCNHYGWLGVCMDVLAKPVLMQLTSDSHVDTFHPVTNIHGEEWPLIKKALCGGGGTLSFELWGGLRE